MRCCAAGVPWVCVGLEAADVYGLCFVIVIDLWASIQSALDCVCYWTWESVVNSQLRDAFWRSIFCSCWLFMVCRGMDRTLPSVCFCSLCRALGCFRACLILYVSCGLLCDGFLVVCVDCDAQLIKRLGLMGLCVVVLVVVFFCVHSLHNNGPKIV